MTLRNARILSSCNDASNKQERKMNVNIKLEDYTPHTHLPIYQNVPPMANFIIQPAQTVGEFAPSQSTVSKFSTVQNRDIDLTKDILQKDLQITDLEDKNYMVKFSTYYYP